MLRAERPSKRHARCDRARPPEKCAGGFFGAFELTQMQRDLLADARAGAQPTMRPRYALGEHVFAYGRFLLHNGIDHCLKRRSIGILEEAIRVGLDSGEIGDGEYWLS